MSNIDKLLYIDGLGEITQNLNIGGNINVTENIFTSKLGINKSSPEKILHIDGQGYDLETGKYLEVAKFDFQWTAATSSTYKPSGHTTTTFKNSYIKFTGDPPFHEPSTYYDYGAIWPTIATNYSTLFFSTMCDAPSSALYDDTRTGLYTGYLTYTVHQNQLSFTGQHRCVPNNLTYYNNISNYIGLIVYATGDYKTYVNDILETDINAITLNDSLPIIELTNRKQDKTVFGIISDKEEDERIYKAGAFCTPFSNINDDKRLYINSIGEGAIWIVNTNGNLENGDYIQSSNVIGMGEKQDDDLLHNYTVAKITCNCNFDIFSAKYKCEAFVDDTSGNTYLKAFVGCTYHCG